MRKILWLHTTPFTPSNEIQGGAWAQSLAERVQKTGQVQIYHIAVDDVKEVQKKDFNAIPQWIIPIDKGFYHTQQASQRTCRIISQIEQEIQPDLVHIWGTESIWCSVYSQGYIKSPLLLDMQGFLSQCYYFYYGGLTFSEVLQCIHLKEIIMPWRTLFRKKKKFGKRGKYEIRYLQKIKNISVQSEWVKNHVRVINPKAHLYQTNIILRSNFYDAEPWRNHTFDDSPIIYSSCNAAESYKGIHILLKALVILKRKYPKIQLHLAGTILIGNRLLDGYSVFLKNFIQKNDLQDNICYLGRLNAEQIIHELQHANVCVIPSFVETYCLGFAESMILGVPTVVSYAGAMSELAKHGEEALFYNSMDYAICASYIDELLQNKSLAEKLSTNARLRRIQENNPDSIVQNQLAIYDEFFNINK